MNRIAILFFVIALLSTNVRANWSQENINQITKEIQKNIPDWTAEKSIDILNKSESFGHYTKAIPTDKGIIRIEIVGETILINGKDISGNLGSKITHGNNSPIIGDVKDSQVAIGEQATAKKETKILKINLYLSIAFTVSFITNIYLGVKLKFKKKKS